MFKRMQEVLGDSQSHEQAMKSRQYTAIIKNIDQNWNKKTYLTLAEDLKRLFTMAKL